MEAIIFIGLQGSGKSTFYKENFFNTHLRISNDLLKTKNRQRRLLSFCTDTQMKLVIDNTNLTKEVRQPYMEHLRSCHYQVIGYYFKPDLPKSLRWNQQRPASEIVPEAGILSAYRSLEKPSVAEGFDAIYCVEISENTKHIETWHDEICRS